jgi:hypothetical protein
VRPGTQPSGVPSQLADTVFSGGKYWCSANTTTDSLHGSDDINDTLSRTSNFRPLYVHLVMTKSGSGMPLQSVDPHQLYVNSKDACVHPPCVLATILEDAVPASVLPKSYNND